MRGGKPRINECGHPERKHHAHGLCFECYRKTDKYKAIQKKTEQREERKLARLESSRSAKSRAVQKAYRQSERCKYLKKLQRERKYGIEYDVEFARQDGLCKLCREKQQTEKAFAIDHDHETGLFRGLLCDACNISIGRFKDDPELLRRAADYCENMGNIPLDFTRKNQ